MISYLQGKIILKKDKFIILEVNNIGYKVFLSRQTLSRLGRGSSIPSESGLRLPEIESAINPVRNSPPTGPSGAQTPLEVIESQSNSVKNKSLTGHSAGEISNGVKVFIYHDIKEDKSDLYGFLTYEELEFFETLNDIRGIGPKAALEISVVGPLEKIKDKILKQDENVFAGIPGIGSKRAMTIILELTGKIKQLGQKSSSADEAENALVQLGFSKQQAKEALSHIASNIKNTEERIKLALKNLGK